MKIGHRILGLGLTPKLLLAGACLLIIPWLGLQTLQAMQRFLIDGQAQAQLLTARGIATLFHGRDDLFIEPSDDNSDFADIPLYPLAGRILLDGYEEDWQSLDEHALVFDSDNGSGFSVLLGQNGDHVYGLVRVRDASPVYRHPGYLRLDHSDHVRLYTNDDTGQTRRYQLTFEGSGRITTYAMDTAWQLADPGSPEYRIRGQARIMADGYQLEFALPRDFVGGDGARLGVAMADVEDSRERVIARLVKSFPSVEQGIYNRLIIRSPETERVLESLATSDARIWVLDRELRVRAAVGELYDNSIDEDISGTEAIETRAGLGGLLLGRLSGTGQLPVDDFDPRQTHSREDRFLRAALAGEGGVSTRLALDGEHVVVAATHPIMHRDNHTVIGVVLLEQTTNAILNLQSRSIQQIVLLSLGGLIAVSAFVLLFSSRLTWRIKRLGNDTHRACDEQGRMQAAKFRGRLAGDEIGDLTRQIEQLLARLERYQQFLIAIPRTLRHEINNPLNTVGTSLEHLENNPDDRRFLASARRGLHRITTITDSLAEAANLEEALSTEHMEVFDLTQLLTNYVDNQRRQRRQTIDLDIPPQAVWLRGSDMHIEQLLDKLLDNAADFSPADQAIEIKLDTDRSQCFMSVTNHGPPIPEAQLPELFQLFQSRRDKHTDAGQAGQHLGLGLYIARLICERHGGDLKAENLKLAPGVVFTARLPLAD